MKKFDPPIYEVTLRLPAIYARDRASRDLAVGEVLAANTRTLTVRANDATLADMISDASHYAGGGMDECSAPVIRSAAQAMAVLKAVPLIDVRCEIAKLENRIKSHGYTLEYQLFCECAGTPGFIGQIRGVTDRIHQHVRIAIIANPTPEMRLEIVAHELRHIEEPEWKCGSEAPWLTKMHKVRIPKSMMGQAYNWCYKNIGNIHGKWWFHGVNITKEAVVVFEIEDDIKAVEFKMRFG